MGVAAVNQNVAPLEQRQQFVDNVVYSGAGFDHDHDLARRLKRSDKLLNRVTSKNRLPLAPSLHKVVDLRGRAVKDGDLVTAALHVQDQVFAHHGQTDQADVACGSFRHDLCLAN